MEFLNRALAGESRALARVITLVENNTAEGRDYLRALYGLAGRAQIIGITGAPGSGKSTLVNQLAKAFRALGKTVGVIAVDPSSAMTGGAILGDRVRMQDLSGDPGVFIRSTATRGALGGLTRTTGEVITVLDAVGKEVILVETVGVGQDEVDIARAAHTTIVVGVPGLGDDIQAIKAGVLEIADIYVVNKADKDGAERLVQELQMLLSLSNESAWSIPIVRTVAVRGEGISELMDSLQNHWRHLLDSGRIRDDRLRRAREELLTTTREELVKRLFKTEAAQNTFDELASALADRTIDPYSAAENLLRSIASAEGSALRGRVAYKPRKPSAV